VEDGARFRTVLRIHRVEGSDAAENAAVLLDHLEESGLRIGTG